MNVQDEERRRSEARRGLELQGLQSHEPAGPQERVLLQQEVRFFRHNIVIVYMKLRWILMHWRLGRRTDATEESAHAEVMKLVQESVSQLQCWLHSGWMMFFLEYVFLSVYVGKI